MSSEPPRARIADGESDAVIGRRIADRYEVTGVVARGGMARVYRARDDRLDRDVALKILSRPFAGDEEQVERFLGEARTAASLSHPNLVHVYDTGTDGGLHFIAMEMLEDYRSLRAVVADRGPLAPSRVAEIGDDLLAGLELVHERGYVHCDVKSANVMLGPGPTKLIDFGIARSPAHEPAGETSIGSLHYMAPEQLHGDGLSVASDLYGLGVVLYEALTGRVPFEGRTPTEVAAAQRAGPPVVPGRLVDGVPQQLDRVVLQALAIDPGHRFASAAAMRRALASVAPEPVAAPVQQPQGSDEETTMFRRPAPNRADSYIPPPAGSPPPRRRRSAAPPRRGRSSLGPWIATLLSLGAVAFVVWLVFAVGSGDVRFGGASPSAAPSVSPANGLVVIPNTIGMTFEQGTDAATRAGLNWTVACDTQPNLPEQIYDQEPAAGAQVAPGSRFTMFFPRFEGYCD